MRFHQACTRWKDRWKGKEQATQNRPVVLRNQACGNAHRSTEYESNDPLMRLNPLNRREAGPYKHRLYLTASHSANDTPNHTGIRDSVATRVRGLNLHSSQVVAAA